MAEWYSRYGAVLEVC